MQDLIVIALLACVIAGVVIYLIRQKKNGAKCIGCPYAKECGGKCSSSIEDQDKTK